MTTPTTSKIVIVSGQEFSVPAETDNEAIREHLKANGFPDVAAATIQTGTRTVEGVETQTIEFVKRAGTKGLAGAELAELLASVPAERLTVEREPRSLAELLRKLEAGQLTVGRALADLPTLRHALELCESRSFASTQEGAQLCSRVDRLPAVACATPSAW